VLCQMAAVLLCAVCLVPGESDAATKSDVGYNVLLPRPCPADVIIDRRDLVVRYLPSGKLWLNAEQLDEDGLRSRLQAALTTRAEKLVWIAADEHVSYGEVLSVISTLKQDTPDLHIALATKAQTGPVDPTDIEFTKTQLNAKLGISMLCVRLPPEKSALQ